MSFSKPKIQTPAAAPPTPDITPAEQKLGSAENPTAAALDKRKKGRSALRIDLQHGGSGLSAGQTGVNVPTK
jgi:hypothetical protein